MYMNGSIIYSLTTRGLYSELSNLVLAKVYADVYNKRIIVNTKNWNARVNDGWNDYFMPTLPCRNDFLTAQLKIYTTEKPWLGKIYYSPKEFFTFYFFYYSNKLYSMFHPNTELTKDVFPKMCSKQFVEERLGNRHFEMFSSAFKDIYKYSNSTKTYIDEMKEKIKIPNNYIGVHIRRGDKITTNEMNEIKIDKYIDEILKRKEISKNIYIATDDLSIIKYLQQLLTSQGFILYYNKDNEQYGFDENTFNRNSKRKKYFNTLNMMLDLDILIHSRYFIGTYTSNVSRVVPLYLGLDKCISLDSDWDLLYR